MSCLGECWDLGPPPDTILFLPPPPAPSFLQGRQHHSQDNVTASPCAAQLCEWGGGNGGPMLGGNAVSTSDVGGDYMEMPHHEMESTSWPGSDTWLLVVVASSIGVLLLGALLALLLLKCREEHRQQTKHLEQRQVSSGTAKSRIHHHHHHHHQGTEAGDNRMVWAALTPRGGTHHYVADGTCSFRSGPHLPPPPTPPPAQHTETEDHYETIDENGLSTVAYQQRHNSKLASFDNSGFTDFDYDEPTPLMQLGYGQDMRCISTLRRLPPPPRPTVSSPTRIEHPNLPPLNLNPQMMTTTTRKGSTLSRRPSDANAILKYNIN